VLSVAFVPSTVSSGFVMLVVIVLRTYMPIPVLTEALVARFIKREELFVVFMPFFTQAG
jgi:hypothetical protein